MTINELNQREPRIHPEPEGQSKFNAPIDMLIRKLNSFKLIQYVEVHVNEKCIEGNSLKQKSRNGTIVSIYSLTSCTFERWVFVLSYKVCPQRI